MKPCELYNTFTSIYDSLTNILYQEGRNKNIYHQELFFQPQLTSLVKYKNKVLQIKYNIHFLS